MFPAGVKLSTFDAAKKLLAAGEKAYQEEIAKLGVAGPVKQAKAACCHS